MIIVCKLIILISSPRARTLDIGQLKKQPWPWLRLKWQKEEMNFGLEWQKEYVLFVSAFSRQWNCTQSTESAMTRLPKKDKRQNGNFHFLRLKRTSRNCDETMHKCPVDPLSATWIRGTANRTNWTRTLLWERKFQSLILQLQWWMHKSMHGIA